MLSFYFIGFLTISPRSGIVLRGTNVKMSGPCFTANDNIVVQLGNDVGKIKRKEQEFCLVRRMIKHQGFCSTTKLKI